MIYACKPEKLGIYINSGRKSIDQIKDETGADIIINGGLYDMSTFTAVCHLKADGVIYAADEWQYFGYGWNDSDIRLTADYSNLKNYICCVCLVRNGKPEQLLYPVGMGGARPRTMIGVYPDCRVLFYAESTPKTPESLREFAVSLGLDSALMLDGGQSTQGISPSGAYRQSRKCHNFILAWLKVTPASPCPYEEPTALMSRWNYTTEGAKWVQWHLNYHGAKLDIDGIIGGKTHAAIVAFQIDHGLLADGIVGNLTRSKMKTYYVEEPAPIRIIDPGYKWASTPSKRASTSYIILHHAGVTSATPESIHNYHKSLGWCGIGYNYYIRKDGTIYNGRPIDCIGAHTVGYNNKSVGICFEGNFETETMSAAQKAAGKQLIKYVKSFYPNAVLKKHKDLDATACPGKNFPYAEITGG